MNKQISTALILTPIAILAAFVIGISMGQGRMEDLIKMQAVSTNHAEWVADSNGKPVFKWKDIK